LCPTELAHRAAFQGLYPQTAPELRLGDGLILSFFRDDYLITLLIESPERCQLQQQTGGNNCRFRCGRLQSSAFLSAVAEFT
jgi:hypothetical protein